VYAGAQELKPIRNGLGIAIVSTSRGVMTDRQARAARMGGEVMALVW
jgi:small subunit ribosomal protein S8